MTRLLSPQTRMDSQRIGLSVLSGQPRNRYSANNKLVDRSFSYPSSQRRMRMSTSSIITEVSLVVPNIPTDHITLARHAGGTSVFLQFADGQSATVNLADLHIDTTVLKLETTHASAWGSAIEVENVHGRIIQIDSAVLRAHCDPQYARRLEQDIAKLGANRSGSKRPKTA